MRKENRANGFNFEEIIIERHSLVPSDNYSHKWDAFTKGGVPVSIKTIGKNHEIGFGSIFRQADISEPYFYLIVGIWHESPNYVEEVYAVKVKTEMWNKMFDLDTINRIKTMVNWARGGRFDSNKIHYWHTLREQANKRWAKRTPNIMKLRLRVINTSSSGAKREGFRPQCGMSVSDFMKHFINNKSVASVKVSPVDLSTKIAKPTDYDKMVDEIYDELFEDNVENKEERDINLFNMVDDESIDKE